mmetsp:Transcript_15531/g.23502  ORF Transcript_15531/g.23502 Transcript_15531/m.23502 type:complete len:81 (+) Transcript_15531:91-333(+)
MLNKTTGCVDLEFWQDRPILATKKEGVQKIANRSHSIVLQQATGGARGRPAGGAGHGEVIISESFRFWLKVLQPLNLKRH